MVYSLTYRRPVYTPNSGRSSVTSMEAFGSSNASLNSGKSGTPAGIPDALAFDKIVNGGTCPVSRLVIFYSEELPMYYFQHLGRNHELELRQ
jgi:hypothetical protein